jgi:hypothetical protein
MALSDDGAAFAAAILSWQRLPPWPPSSVHAGSFPPIPPEDAAELVDWAEAQVAQLGAHKDIAALYGLSRAHLCVLMLLKHPDAFQRLQAWHVFFQRCLHQSDWDEQRKAIDPAQRLLEGALRRLPPLATGTPGYRLVPVADFSFRPRAYTADNPIGFSVKFAELLGFEEGLDALEDAQREIPESAFSLVVHEDISGYAVDVRPVIGTHRRAIRDCTLMDGRTTNPRMTLPLCYITHSGQLTTCGGITGEIFDGSPDRTSHEPGT